MRKPSTHANPSTQTDEPAIIYTDDGGSGLLEACKTRFPPPGYKVECDARHTVWVKRTDGTHSIGLPPWLLRRQSMSEVLEHVEKKLNPPGEKH
jgi:hypothetical protein